MNNIKIGLRAKIILTIIVFVFTLTIISIITGYLSLYSTITRVAGESYGAIASLAASSVADIMDREARLAKSDAALTILAEAVKDRNAKYALDEEAAKRSLADMDKRWAAASPDDPLVREYLDNKASARLRSLLGDREKQVDILVTDKYGGLVAATRKPSDFYQGEKDWWQRAFADGKGKVSVGGIVADERTKLWAIPLAAPIIDERGEVIGVYETLLDISVFASPVEGIRINKTGNAAIVDDKGYIVFYPSVAPFVNKFCEYSEMQRALEEKARWMILKTAYLHTPRAFTVYADIANPLFTQSGIIWRVFVVQDASELLEPMGAFTGRVSLVTVFLIIVIFFVMIFLFNVTFIKPVRELQDGMASIGKGNLDHRVMISSGDEMGELAGSFNDMVQGLKKSVVPIASFEKEARLREKAEQRANAISSDVVSEAGRLREDMAAIRNEMKTLDKQKKPADALESYVARTAKTVDELADTAAIEKGALGLNVGPVDFRGIVKDEVFLYEPKIRAKGLDLKLDMPANKIMINADAVRLKQAFSNLAENAVKFTEKGQIAISIKELQNTVECHIADTGLSIPRDSLPSAFERAERTGDIPGRKARGGGAGLFIAKGIIEAHKGSVRAESEVGKGVKFTIILPKTATA